MGLECVEQGRCGLQARPPQFRAVALPPEPLPTPLLGGGGVFLGVPLRVTRCLLLCKEGESAFKDHIQENLW